MEIPGGNSLNMRGSAYSFLVLLIGLHEGVRLTHHTPECAASIRIDARRCSIWIALEVKRTFVQTYEYTL
jgi:hypothetical protein